MDDHALPGYHIFALPVFDRFLLYSPFHTFAALVNRASVSQLQRRLLAGSETVAEPLKQILETFQSYGDPRPSRKEARFVPPFLGLVTTRACDLACKYCGFWNGNDPGTTMSLKLVRDSVDWYLDLVCQAGQPDAQIHFFGGEPFSAEEVVDFAMHYARARAAGSGLAVRFEVATNGTFSQERCQWVADCFDTVVLSLDGPADVHNFHRPKRGGQGSFEIVTRNAGILSEGQAALCLRACVTRDTVNRMEEIAHWFCETFHPQSVCFETLQPTTQSEAAGLYPPDPWLFARNFIRAAEVLEAWGVEPVYATADIRARRITFCPVGQDVAIVSPDGTLAACYLLRRDWEAQGLDLRLGNIDACGNVSLDLNAVESIRGMNMLNRPSCECCFCRWHCAGGCYVHHRLPGLPGSYDRLCIQARVIALWNILKAMRQEDLARRLLQDSTALEAAVWQCTDRLCDLRSGGDQAGRLARSC